MEIRNCRTMANHPLLTHDLVIFGNPYDTVFALSQATGNIVWKKNLTKLNYTPGYIYANPLYDDGKVITMADNRVVALDVGTGNIIWEYYATNWLTGTPALNHGTLYFPITESLFSNNYTDDIIALNVKDGTLKWQQPTHVISVVNLICANQKLYFTDYNGLYVADANTGDVQTSILYGYNDPSPFTVTINDTAYYCSQHGNFR